MGDMWKHTQLGEVIEVNPTRSLSRGSISKKVAMENVTENQRKISFTSNDKYSGSGSRFQNGDTLFARITPCLENGKTAFVDILQKGVIAFGSTEFIVLSGIENITDPLYVYYLARTPHFRQYAMKRMTGSSGRQRVPADSIKKYPLDLPPLPTQRRIAHILGSLDDKIELNRRMNATLEAIARAIFKSWFVDFDPVRAKLDGRDTGLPAEIAALFPDGFADSELGKIPRGWRVGELKESFNITMGQSPPGSAYNEMGVGLPFYQGRRDFSFRYPERRIYCNAPKRIANSGDTLVSVRAPVGDLNMASETCCIGRGVAAVRHKTGSRSYTYYAMQHLQSDLARFEAEGTVFGSINKGAFEGLPFIITPGNVVDAFEEKIFPIDQSIEISTLQNKILTKIRNTLLPKLMNGEIEV